nr:reverse transcriptase domain-containing protein [Tanacetum cinerariifolium]
MFNSTLTGNARVWFGDLPKDSIDSYDDLKESFLENYLQQKNASKIQLKFIISSREMRNPWKNLCEARSQTDAKLQEWKLWKATKVRAKAGQIHPPDKNTKRNTGLDKGKFKPPPSMITPIEKTLANSTSFIGNKPMEKTRQRQQKGGNVKKGKIASNTNGEEDGTKGPMIIKAEMRGHFVHRMFRLEVRSQMVPATTPLIEFCEEIIWPRGQISLLVKIGDEEQSMSAWMNFMVVRGRAKGVVRSTKTHLDIFAWKLADMTGFPHHIAEHMLNIHEGCLPVRQKKTGQTPERNKAIYEEVEKLVDASIMKDVHYHSRLSNPVMVKKHDGSWRTCVDFKDLDKACPKNGYPLLEMDWKVESLCGYPFKYFLDAYKGYNQIKMAKEDEEKTTFITSQGILCYSKMRFGLKNARATYQRLLDKAFQKQIGRNLEVYVGDLVIKSCTEQEEPGMIKYLEKAKALTSTFKEFSIKQVPRGENKKADALSKIASTSFAHLSKQVLVEELKEKSIDEKEVLAVVEKEGRTPLQANYVLREIHEGSCSMLAGPRSVVAKALRLGRLFPEGHGKVKFLIVAIDYFTKWIEAKLATTITGAQIKKFVSDSIVCRFGLPGEIISDNEKQFRDKPFKDWCEKLCEGIKARLDERSKNLMKDISHVLWAHRTMIKSSNRETPFSLTYWTKAVIPVEIGMPTLRTSKADMIKNDEALEINLDLLEEKREQAAIQEAKSKSMMEKYYNVRNTSFKPGDLVYRSNEESNAEEGGKLRPKWKGPYEVT